MILKRLRAQFSRAKKQPADAVDRDRWPLAVSPGARASVHEEGLTILHIPSGRVFVCNRSAARIWQGASKGLSIDRLSEEMSGEYSIARDIVQRDTRLLVGQMEHHGLISRSAV
jgi:hypothetical protein